MSQAGDLRHLSQFFILGDARSHQSDYRLQAEWHLLQSPGWPFLLRMGSGRLGSKQVWGLGVDTVAGEEPGRGAWAPSGEPWPEYLLTLVGNHSPRGHSPQQMEPIKSEQLPALPTHLEVLPRLMPPCDCAVKQDSPPRCRPKWQRPLSSYLGHPTIPAARAGHPMSGSPLALPQDSTSSVWSLGVIQV